MRHIRFGVKIVAASDMESDCPILRLWVLSPNLYMLAKCMYNRCPVRSWVSVCTDDIDSQITKNY